MRWNVAQSKHNIDSNRYLTKANPDYRDWEITTLFYSAVHIVNTYFLLAAKKSPNTHQQRKKLVESELYPIYSAYYSLEHLSRKSRYDIPHQDLTPEEGDEAVRCHSIIINYMKKQLQKFGDDAVQMSRDDDFLESLR